MFSSFVSQFPGGLLQARCAHFAACVVISPQHFMGFTLIILIVLMRRDFRSRTLSVLSE